ncbi:unnamed protein product [Ceutorhynchus assimilis]|uniref:Uncharacterized protein n=1 Tax=Ceutorhynchus assimilis TaxID=467358 RepID=A0A9N9MV54_9CUCU|nr:unnamed protein product [Ceutorhynchus assimilis]
MIGSAVPGEVELAMNNMVTRRYMGEVTIRRSIKAYIDTGSEQNIIRRECFETLGDYQINPSSIALKALASHYGQGQPALATKGVVLTVHEGKAQLTSTEKEKAEDFIQNITLGEDETEAQEDVTVSPGEESEGLHQGETGYIPVSRYERNGAVVAIGNHVLKSGDSDGLKVRNLGHRPLQWKTGQVVARAVKMSVAKPKKLGEKIALKNYNGVPRSPTTTISPNQLKLYKKKIGWKIEKFREDFHDNVKPPSN